MMVGTPPPTAEPIMVWPPPPPEPPGTKSCASPTPTPEALATMLLSQEVQKVEKSIVLCVAVDGQDVTPAILSAIQTKDRSVVRDSECVAKMSGSYQKKTHHKAILVSVESFCPTTPDNADVDLNLYHAGLWAIFKTLEVRRNGDAWVVVRVKRHVEA